MAGTIAYTEILGSGSFKDKSGGFTKVRLADGTIQTFEGDRAFRNNNPGNLTGTARGAENLGAIGVDYGGNYIFSSMQNGFNAQRQFVLREQGDKTLADMVATYAPPGADNDPFDTNKTYPEYLKGKGFDLNTKVKDLPVAEQERLLAVMIQKESKLSDEILALVNIGDRSNLVSGQQRAEAKEGEDGVSSLSDDGISGATEQRNDQSLAPETVGFKDPFKNFPRQDYYNEATTNRAARGQWEPKLQMGGGSYKGGSLFPTEANPEYPYNKVTETSSGHRIELDDTPGKERVTMVHTVGSGMEFHADGMVVLNAHDKMVQVVGDDFTVYVRGNGDVTFEGNLNMHVTGDYKLKVDKNFILEVDGKYIQTIGQGKNETVEADKISTVVGNLSESITKNSTRMSLGGANIITKGNFNLWTDGNAEYGTSGSTHLSAQTEIDIATLDFNMTSEYMALVAPDGKVGGENITVTGDTFSGQTYLGDVFSGTAKAAYSAAIWPDASVLNPGDLAKLAAASLDIVTDTLGNSNKGILKIDVDPEEKILQNLDLREMSTVGENTSTTSKPSKYSLENTLNTINNLVP